MTTTADLVRTTRRFLQGNAREAQNALAVAYTAGGTTMDLAYPIPGITAGSLVEVEWTLYTVVDADASTRRITVLLDDEFGSPISHPVNARVVMRPRFPSTRIVAALNTELDALSGAGPGLFAVSRVVADAEGVLVVPSNALTILAVADTDERRRPASWFSLASTGSGLEVRSYYDYAGHEFIFGLPFGHLSGDPGEDVETATGLPATGHDLPTYGAALHLGGGVELQRSLPDVQGDTRRAEEVPVTGYLSGLRTLAALRTERVLSEAQRLQATYGVKKQAAV